MSEQDLSQLSMLDLFRVEAETQAQVLTSGLLALERDPTLADQLEACMRAAHSLKGAARIVGLAVGVRVAHAMEDCFVAAQQGQLTLRQAHIDLLLGDHGPAGAHRPHRGGGDRRSGTTRRSPKSTHGWPRSPASSTATPAPRRRGDGAARPPAAAADAGAPSTTGRPSSRAARLRPRAARLGGEPESPAEPGGRVAGRVALGQAVRRSLLRLKRLHHDLAQDARNRAADARSERAADDPAQAALADAQRRVVENEQFLAQRLAELEMFDRRSINLAHRLYDEALACRMRPFADGVEGLPRMVRDLARSLGRQVKLEIVGGATQVDRDILAKLDAPLGHLLRNAVDHGIESPDERARPPASRRRASCGSRRVTAPARCTSSCRTTAAASISRSCARPSSRGT